MEAHFKHKEFSVLVDADKVLAEGLGMPRCATLFIGS